MNKISSESSLYRELVNVDYLRPIRTEERYKEILDTVESLIFKMDLSKEEQDYLDTLGLLVEKYEEVQCPMHDEVQEPLERLKFLLSENGMNGSDLGTLLGNRSLGGAILRGERGLSKAHIKILSEHFRVSANLFL